MTRLRGDAPHVLFVTHDRKYRLTEVHYSHADAAREVSRDPEWIDLVEYRPVPKEPR